MFHFEQSGNTNRANVPWCEVIDRTHVIERWLRENADVAQLHREITTDHSAMKSTITISYGGVVVFIATGSRRFGFDVTFNDELRNHVRHFLLENTLHY